MDSEGSVASWNYCDTGCRLQRASWMSQHTSLAEEPGRAFEVKLRNASRELATQEPIYIFRGGKMEHCFTKQAAAREQGVAPTHAAHDHTAHVRTESSSRTHAPFRSSRLRASICTRTDVVTPPFTALPEPEHPPASTTLLTQEMLTLPGIILGGMKMASHTRCQALEIAFFGNLRIPNCVPHPKYGTYSYITSLCHKISQKQRRHCTQRDATEGLRGKDTHCRRLWIREVVPAIM